MYDIIELNNKLLPELKDIAKGLNIPQFDILKKQDLIYAILDFQAMNSKTEQPDNGNSNGDKQKKFRKPRSREQTPADAIIPETLKKEDPCLAENIF
ncbi:MAG: Rho termination factor N-terminal domain-containing protein, partial [Bacteroidales bacterium]|nr:Rho termination factor N-terminal domain-containing protein [Bacteroidales bacterium]